MILMKITERDLELKLKIMHFLWYNGFFVRNNVRLARYQYGERTSGIYTDIDVLGIQFDEFFKHKTILCDCKSGKVARNKDRLFWLVGVIKFLDAEGGIFLRNQINEKDNFELSKKLNITPLSLKRLEELAKNNKIIDKPFVGPFNYSLLEKEEEIFKKLKNESKGVHDYLIYRYWNDPSQRQIKLLISSLKEIMDLETVTNEEKMFLQVYILSLLSVSILKFSEPVLIMDKSLAEEHIKENILGEEIEISERKKVLGSYYDLLKTTEEYRDSLPKKEDFVNQIYLDYTKYLIDLIQRICINPIESRQIPRILDTIAYEVILNKEYDIQDKLFSSNNYFDLNLSLKLTKNIFTFAYRGNALLDVDYEIFMEMFDKLEKL